MYIASSVCLRSLPASPSRSPGLALISLCAARSFITFAMYTAYAPFKKPTDDWLSIICQLQVFVTLLVTIIRRANPDSLLVPYLMNGFLMLPLTASIVFNLDLIGRCTRWRNWLLSLSTIDESLVRAFDSLIGAEKMYTETQIKTGQKEPVDMSGALLFSMAPVEAASAAVHDSKELPLDSPLPPPLGPSQALVPPEQATNSDPAYAPAFSDSLKEPNNAALAA